MNFDTMTDDQLEAEKLDLDRQIAELREKKRAIAQVQDVRLARAAAQARLDRMSDSEKRELAQLIAAESISSGEQFGEPGSK